MGICADELRNWVIRPTLEAMGVQSKSIENLLLGTAAHASGLGYVLHQTNEEGLRYGLYGIDPNTHQKCWDKHLVLEPDTASYVRGLASQRGFLQEPHGELATNMAYATAIAWSIYLYRGLSYPLPHQCSAPLLAEYWARYFPCASSQDTEDGFIKAYHAYVMSGPTIAA